MLPYKFVGILLALTLLTTGGFTYAAQESDANATTTAMPYTLEHGHTAGTPSEAKRKAESGASGITQSRMRDAAVFQLDAGHWWRAIRNGPVTFYGGWLLALLPVLILGFYAVFGPITLHDAPSGRFIQRFTLPERVMHWTTAILFVVLALTGIIILFGKHLIIPLIGHGPFSWVAIIAKNVHNLAGPLFAICIVLMFVTFVRDNLFSRMDLQWFANVHQVLTGKKHIPSSKYNGGEKLWFWGGVTLLGMVVSISGLVLDFPTFEQSRETMQIANLVHAISALLFIAAGLGHIYMGTIGTHGAFQGMKTGMVDETWAREHHQLWYEEIRQQQSR